MWRRISVKAIGNIHLKNILNVIEAETKRIGPCPPLAVKKLIEAKTTEKGESV